MAWNISLRFSGGIGRSDRSTSVMTLRLKAGIQAPQPRQTWSTTAGERPVGASRSAMLINVWLALGSRHEAEGLRTGLETESAAVTVISSDLRQKRCLAHAIMITGLYPEHEFAAAGTAVTDKRRSLANIIGDMGQIILSSIIKDRQQFILILLLGKTTSSHKLGSRSE